MTRTELLQQILAQQGEASGNEPMWALIGVAGGAILGGVAQIISDHLRARRDKIRGICEERRKAYDRFLGAVSKVHNANLFPVVGGLALKEGADDVPTLAKAIGERMLEASLVIDVALGSVQLVGPSSVADKAQEIERFLIKMLSSNEDYMDGLQQLLAEFVALAQPHSDLSD